MDETILHYRMFRSLPAIRMDRVTWKTRLQAWVSAHEPLAGRKEDLTQKDFFRLFWALAKLFDISQKTIWIEIVVPEDPEFSIFGIASLTKDFFVEGAISDIEIGSARMKDLRAQEKTRWARLTWEEPQEWVRKRTVRSFWSRIRYALQNYTKKKGHPGFVRRLRLDWDAFLLEAMAYDLMRLGNALRKDDADCFRRSQYSFRWPFASRLGHWLLKAIQKYPTWPIRRAWVCRKPAGYWLR